MTVVNSLLNERESPRVAMVSIRPIEPLTVKVAMTETMMSTQP